jgi:hypothetical protein
MQKFIAAVFLTLFALGASPLGAEVIVVLPVPHPIHHRRHWHRRPVHHEIIIRPEDHR